MPMTTTRRLMSSARSPNRRVGNGEITWLPRLRLAARSSALSDTQAGYRCPRGDDCDQAQRTPAVERERNRGPGPGDGGDPGDQQRAGLLEERGDGRDETADRRR